jgi:hypothetical protein
VNPYQLVPSTHRNEKMSVFPTVVVRVGAVPDAQDTVPGQVTV